MRKVVAQERQDVRLLSEVTKDKGYVMVGTKGNYILGRNTDGRFIWVKATPGSITKPVKDYATLKDAVEDKINNGFEVLEFDSVIFE